MITPISFRQYFYYDTRKLMQKRLRESEQTLGGNQRNRQEKSSPAQLC